MGFHAGKMQGNWFSVHFSLCSESWGSAFPELFDLCTLTLLTTLGISSSLQSPLKPQKQAPCCHLHIPIHTVHT